MRRPAGVGKARGLAAQPCDETAKLKDHMAFYVDRMDDIIVSGE